MLWSISQYLLLTMSCFWALVFVFSGGVLQGSVAQKGYYTVVAPRVLRPNSDYHVSVTTMMVSQPTTVFVDIGGKQDSGGMFKTSQFMAVEPYVSRILQLKIGDIGPGNYNLTVRGEGGLNFYNTTNLSYVHKSYSVFIQTDKAIYKPGHKVQFRAIALNAHLKPSITGTLDIHITDGKGNRVKQWLRVIPIRGVFSGELELSQSPVLGDWTISVKILDQTFTKQFTVAEYVLPKFEVTVDVPKHATFKDSKVVATIRSRYTYGRAVKGEATVTAFPAYVSDIIQPVFEQPVHKVIPIDGKASVEFDITKELNLKNDYERTIQFDVTVKEDLTGRKQNSSAQTMIHKHKYTLELVKTSEYFKPGLKYTVFIKLAHHDGVPVIDKTNPVKVFSGFDYNSDNYTESQHYLSSNGIIELTFYPPTNVTVLGLAAEYLDVKEWFSIVTAAVSPSNTFIQTSVNTENPKVNSDIELQVNSTAPLKYLSYSVLGRGDVIVANSVEVNGMKTAKWRFQATYAMAPTAHVIVQYVREEDGEVIADALDIQLDGAMQNFVDLDVKPEETEPGNVVEINYAAKPMSYVGLLGVDQSVLLLKTGNDITKDDVITELSSYDSSSSSMFSTIMRGLQRDSSRSMFWWPGSLTAHEAFQKSGALIMTNGYVHEHTPWRHDNNSLREDAYLSNIPSRGKKIVKPDIGPPVIVRPVTRPPLAGPYAFSRIPRPVWNRPRVFLQSDVRSTWLFANFSSGIDGKGSFKKAVPDTITSWVVSAFAVDPLYGLGILDIPRKVKVFRPFFVSLDLPYSVIRGETVSIPVVVFNYMDKTIQAEVTFENSGEFEFADYSNDVNDQPKLELFRRKKISVAPNSGAPTSFMITPKEIGYITIKVTAKSALAGDGVERKLLVKPEGETQYKNKAFFVDLRNTNSFKTNVTLDIPANIVPGSEFIEVSAVGDLLGPSILNLEHLIKIPYGCGEQNMLNFVPNIVILNYLKNSNQLTPAIETKAKRFMETGYQQELTYKHSDGSFSAFGSADPSGSTWLTAFVAKSFYQATPHINVEDTIIKEALDWLVTKQEPNGNFPEVGTVSHTDMQGGAGKGLALTAYVLTALLENRRFSAPLRNSINKATDYIVKNFDGLDDIYAIVLSTYALHLAQHPAKDNAFNVLESKAKTANELKWWTKNDNLTSEKNPNAFLPNSIDVEMTAYAMLVYINRGLIEDCLPVMKWLFTQQNDQGGFASTQDTVVALGALAELATSISSGSVDVTTSFSYGNGITKDIRINSAVSMILHKVEIPRKVRQINVTATGSGLAVVQVSYRYNVNVTGPWPLFLLDPQVDKNSDKNHLQLSICSRFTGGNESNMAVMEIVLPSGYTVDSDALPSLQLNHKVKRIETKEGDTTVVLYFDKMTKEEICPTISAYKTHKVALQRPVPIVLYDYYDQSRKARMFYEPLRTMPCDICEGEDCNNICSAKLSSQAGGSSPGSASSFALSAFLHLLIPFIYYVQS
nr:CD109 antigen-like isoform X3 [Halyomorpha halys]